LNCALLCHSSLLIASANNKKLKVFCHFQKIKDEFICQVVEKGDIVCGVKLAEIFQFSMPSGKIC